MRNNQAHCQYEKIEEQDNMVGIRILSSKNGDYGGLNLIL